MKRFLSKHWPLLLTLAFGVVVFLFWRYRYPFALTYQEQFQLFLFDDDYLFSRLAHPGGMARYVAEFLVQFYNSVLLGAVLLALLFMLIQLLVWRLMVGGRPSVALYQYYPLSFLPVVILWYALGDESVLLGYVVALIFALLMALVVRRIASSVVVRVVLVVLLMPAGYWLIGPMVVLVALLASPWWLAAAAVVELSACILLSAHVLPFPLQRLMLGIGYYRFPVTLPYLLMLIPLVVALLVRTSAMLPDARRRLVVLVGCLLLCVSPLLVDRGFDAKKYEMIEYDYLVRVRDWDAIIRKATQQAPDLPMSVCATNLALAMTNQLGERAFDFYQRGSEGLVPPFEHNFTTTQLTGEIYFHLALVNTAQRFAFEAMESLPDYSKSARCVKRLAETNLINGQYEVARKYLLLLQKTIFYRPWAKRTMAMLGNELQIFDHPLYGTLRKYRLTDDFLFSEDELDKICGQLFIHCPQNQMATQYLLMLPLLNRDLPTFMQYVQVVQNHAPYNPRIIQEAIAIAFMQQRQPLPQGLVSPLVQQQLSSSATWQYLSGKK